MKAAVPLLLLAAWTAMAPAQPTFSARVDGVRVDVLVTDASRRPLGGLAASDFVIRDNGVAQPIDVVSFGEVALNVGLVFDLSESVAGPRLDQLRAASRALSAELHKDDQSALITFDQVISQRCSMSLDHSCVDRALADITPQGSSALVDGVTAGMIAGESDVGRSLLMIFSDGLDTASFLGEDRVLDIGRRSDIVAYPIATKGARPRFLEELADATGGRLHEVDRQEDLAPTFKAILDEFRQRYLITYTPTGVQKGGWHKLEVRVNRSGARVKARPGYQG